MLVLDNLIYRWQKSGGISTVWYELTKRVIEQQQDYIFIEYANSIKNNYLRANEHIPSDHLITLNDMLFPIKRYLPVKFDYDIPFIFHSSYYRTCSNRKAINIITIHDFIYEYYRKGLAKEIHCLSKKNTVKKADYIICISQNTKKDLLHFYPGIDKEKVHVIYNGASESFHPIDTNKDDFLLFVGSRKGYKNFDMAAYAAAKAGMPLIICGKKLDKSEKLFLDKILPNNYKELGFVSEKDLNVLYNKAFALLYPSSYEGFGIPVVEAQKAGCPVIAMNSSSIPEIIGNNMMLCNVSSPEAIVERINLLRENTFRKKVIQEGLKKSKGFSWDLTYKRYAELYSSISKPY